MEPNLKNVKSKISSTWIVQENISNNQQQTQRKPRRNYSESLKVYYLYQTIIRTKLKKIQFLKGSRGST